MTSQLSVLLKKYSIPVLLFVVGIIMLSVGLKNNQDGMFMVSSIMMFAAGGMSILYSSGKFKPAIAYAIGIAAGIAAIIILYVSWKSVSDTEKYMTNYEKCKTLSKQNLEDIRYIQKAYAEKNGVYLSDWDALVEFTKNGTVPFVDAQGVVPGRKLKVEERDYLYHDNRPIDVNMTEGEAFLLSKWKEGPMWQEDFANFKRDTIEVSLLKSKFQSRSYKENREKMGFYPFSPDSLPIIPFTKEKWLLETKDSIKINEVNYPALLVSGKIPFAEIKGKNNDQEDMSFGSLTTNTLEGSWENE